LDCTAITGAMTKLNSGLGTHYRRAGRTRLGRCCPRVLAPAHAIASAPLPMTGHDIFPKPGGDGAAAWRGDALFSDPLPKTGNSFARTAALSAFAPIGQMAGRARLASGAAVSRPGPWGLSRPRQRRRPAAAHALSCAMAPGGTTTAGTRTLRSGRCPAASGGADARPARRFYRW